MTGPRSVCRKYLLSAAVALIPYWLHAQPVLKGTLHWNDRWAQTIYIAELSSFDQVKISDSISVGAEGHFVHTFYPKKSSPGIIRLILPPAGSSPYTFLEGPAENTICVILPDTGVINLEAAADRFYYSFRLNPSTENELTLKTRALKLPFLHLMESLPDSGLTQTTDKGQSRQKVMAQWLELLRQYRHQLEQLLQAESNDRSLLLGLYYHYLSNHGEYDDLFFTGIMHKIQNRRHPLLLQLQNQLSQKSAYTDTTILKGIRLQDSSGNWHVLGEYHSPMLILDFWASWCGPCRYANRESLPALVELARKNGIPFLGINQDQHPMDWLRALRIDRPAGIQFRDAGPAPNLQDFFGINAYPTYLVINPQGLRLLTSSSDAVITRFIQQRLQ